MKKAYMQPAAKALLMETEEMIAVSGGIYVGGDDGSDDVETGLTRKIGWTCDQWWKYDLQEEE